MADRDAAFRADVRSSARLDPYPALRELASSTGLSQAEVVHHALVRWTSAGSEALLSFEPDVLKRLIEARRREDWLTVAGIIDWLEAGL